MTSRTSTGRGRRLAAVTVTVALAGACSSVSQEPEPTDPPSAASDDPDDEGTEDGPDGDRSEDEGPGGDRSEEGVCSDTALASIDEAIDGQLTAFAEGDFAGALDFASDGFRAGLDPEAFEALIEDGYPVAADAAEHRSRECRQPEPEAAEVLVEVTADDGTRGELVYLMVEEEGAWRIAGAVDPDADDPPDGTTTV